MVGLKKRHIKKMLKTGAEADGASLADIRTDIEATIDEAMIRRKVPQISMAFSESAAENSVLCVLT